MYKYSIRDLPVAFNDFFTKGSEIHDYPTRQVNDLNITKNKKSFSDRGIRSSGPVHWNSLSKDLKDSRSVSLFEEIINAI